MRDPQFPDWCRGRPGSCDLEGSRRGRSQAVRPRTRRPCGCKTPVDVAAAPDHPEVGGAPSHHQGATFPGRHRRDIGCATWAGFPGAVTPMIAGRSAHRPAARDHDLHPGSQTISAGEHRRWLAVCALRPTGRGGDQGDPSGAVTALDGEHARRRGGHVARRFCSAIPTVGRRKSDRVSHQVAHAPRRTQSGAWRARRRDRPCLGL